MDLPFEWDEAEAFVRQPDGGKIWPSSLGELAACSLQVPILLVNKGKSVLTLRSDSKEFDWESGESLLRKLELEGIVKEVFPLHDEIKRKQLLRSWAFNFWDVTRQPIDEIYSYFGMKVNVDMVLVATALHTLYVTLSFTLVDFGYATVLWQMSCPVGAEPGYKILEMEWSSFQSPVECIKKWGSDKTIVKEVFQREEWFGRLMRFRNDAIIILSIICLQLPFELAYAHLYEVIKSDLMKFGLTVAYLLAIQYFNRIGGKISVNLIKHENNESTEYRADSLVYKVFGLYFMQSYFGVFYHALLHRNFLTLRRVLIQRLIMSEVLENLIENSLPFLKYSYKKYRAIRKKRKREKGASTGKTQFISRVEKEYLKPAYSASIGEELEDGLFDDFLELALQFGMIMMFACAFPPAFAFAALNNIAEIRTDALKLLVMFKRPIPRAAATIGAWHNIFQFLIVMSICTNCVLLVCLYDQERKWKIEPGLAAILVMEHVLLLIKFVFSRIVPEEPAWVRANRMKNATQAQDVCSKRLLRSISGNDKVFAGSEKFD
ncbi:hypothetical protein U1Q18_042650 [Sarracenia purpurea var. burkii]